MTREEAIKELSVLWERHKQYEGKEAIRYFMDGNYVEALDIAITALEHPEKNVVAVVPCGDAISREAVIDEINRIGVTAFTDYSAYSALFDFVEQLPSVTPQSKPGAMDYDKEKITAAIERMEKEGFRHEIVNVDEIYEEMRSYNLEEIAEEIKNFGNLIYDVLEILEGEE